MLVRGKDIILLITLLGIIVLSLTANTVFAYPGIRTHVPQGLPWYPLAAFGDNRPEDTASVDLPSTYHQLISEVLAARPFALLGTGDHVGSGRLDQIIEFLNTLVGVENVLVIEGNHDVGPAHSYWLKEVAPEMYYWDGLPGWRVVLFSTEISRTEYGKLRAFLDTALNTSRHVILVFHRPAYPNVNYNMDPSMRSILMDEIRKFGNVEIALQGHWHGFAEELVNGTLFIITGGAGAPLYQSGGRNHYLYIVLEPGGGYEVIPVALGPGSGDLVVERSGSEVTIVNTKVGINGSPVKVPVRVRLPIEGIDAYAVMMAPPGATTVSAVVEDGRIIASTNGSTEWYIYYETPGGAAVNASDDGSSLSLPAPPSTGYLTLTATTHELIEETITVTLPRTTTRTVTETATETIATTATRTIIETVTETGIETTTYTVTAAPSTGTPSAADIGMAVIAGVAGALVAYAVARRR